MQFYKSLIAIASCVAAVTADTCNPLKSSQCPADPALGASFKEDFSSKSQYFDEVNKSGLSYSDDGLKFTISKRFDNPSIKSNFYIMFGKVEVVLQGAEGKGIVSSFYLQSDDLDEIDIELIGGDPTQWQSNYFSKGDTTNYDRGAFHNTPGNPLQNFMTYTIEWTEEKLTWSLNGEVVRTLTPDNPEGYPQSPMYIMAGSWAGGDPDNEPGTIEWAGGETDYSEAPFNMYIKSVIVSDYSTGKEYSYGDQSGSYQSIKSNGGKVGGRESEAQAEFASLAEGKAIATHSSSEASSSTTTSSSAVASSSSSSSSSETSTTKTSSSSSSSSETSTTKTSSSSSSSSETSTTKTSSSSSSSSKTSATTSNSQSKSETTSTTSHFLTGVTAKTGSSTSTSRFLTGVTANTGAGSTSDSSIATETSQASSTTVAPGGGQVSNTASITTLSTSSTSESSSPTHSISSNNGASSSKLASISLIFALCGYYIL